MAELSFVIAVYNGTHFLRQCLDSILEQDVSFSEYDIVLVDDCSTDKSVELIMDYVEKYPNVRLVQNKCNQRVGSTLNNGIREVCTIREGYVWFFDQDDILAPRCLNSIITQIRENNLDVLLFNFKKINEQGDEVCSVRNYKTVECCSGLNFIHGLFPSQWVCLSGYTWQSVIKKAVIMDNNILFPDGATYEDTTFLLKSVLYSDRVQAVDNYYYYYRVNTLSIVHTLSYKGRILYEFSYGVGQELEDFSRNIHDKDKEFSDILLGRAIQYYNNFVLPLIQATHIEKKNFYQYVHDNKEVVKSKSAYQSILAKMLLSPWGFIMATVLKPIYLCKRRLKQCVKNR